MFDKWKEEPSITQQRRETYEAQMAERRRSERAIRKRKLGQRRLYDGVLWHVFWGVLWALVVFSVLNWIVLSMVLEASRG